MALKGNQKKLDKNNNNRIDAQDFKILKAEKAKGRGMGLQDEKMKPGKVMKAKRGQFTKSNVSGHSRSSQGTTAKSALGKTFGYSKVFKTGVSAGDKTKATSTIIGVKPSVGGKGGPPSKTPKEAKDFIKRRKKLMGLKSVIGKGGRIGATAALLGLAGAGAAKIGQTIGRKLDEAKKKNKKMGGGMMMRPTNYSEGGDAQRSPTAAQARRMGQRKRKPGLLGGVGKGLGKAGRRAGLPSLPGKRKEDSSVTLGKFMKAKVSGLEESAKVGGIRADRVFSKFRRPDAARKDALKGEFSKKGKIKDAAYYKSIGLTGERGDKSVENFFKPRNLRMSVGGSVTVKTKLGRNKPTKMY